MDKFKDIIEKIETMPVADLHELVKALEEKFGVSAAAFAQYAARAALDAQAAACRRRFCDRDRGRIAVDANTR